MGSARQGKPAAAFCQPGQELTLPLYFSGDSDLWKMFFRGKIRKSGSLGRLVEGGGQKQFLLLCLKFYLCLTEGSDQLWALDGYLLSCKMTTVPVTGIVVDVCVVCKSSE